MLMPVQLLNIVLIARRSSILDVLILLRMEARVACFLGQQLVFLVAEVPFLFCSVRLVVLSRYFLYLLVSMRLVTLFLLVQYLGVFMFPIKLVADVGFEMKRAGH